LPAINQTDTCSPSSSSISEGKHLDTERYDEAPRWLRASAVGCQIDQCATDSREDLGNVGLGLSQLGEPERATPEFSASRGPGGEVAPQRWIASAVCTMPAWRVSASQLEGSRGDYQQSLDLAQSVRSPDDILSTENDLAFSCLSAVEFKTGEEKCDAALQVAAKMGDKSARTSLCFVQWRDCLSKIRERKTAKDLLTNLGTSQDCLLFAALEGGGRGFSQALRRRGGIWRRRMRGSGNLSRPLRNSGRHSQMTSRSFHSLPMQARFMATMPSILWTMAGRIEALKTDRPGPGANIA